MFDGVNGPSIPSFTSLPPISLPTPLILSLKKNEKSLSLHNTGWNAYIDTINRVWMCMVNTTNLRPFQERRRYLSAGTWFKRLPISVRPHSPSHLAAHFQVALESHVYVQHHNPYHVMHSQQLHPHKPSLVRHVSHLLTVQQTEDRYSSVRVAYTLVTIARRKHLDRIFESRLPTQGTGKEFQLEAYSRQVMVLNAVCGKWNKWNEDWPLDWDSTHSC